MGLNCRGEEKFFRDESVVRSSMILGVPHLRILGLGENRFDRLTCGSLLLSVPIGARDQKPKKHDYREECYDSGNAPSEHTGVFFMAEIKHKLPKPCHFCFGHDLYKHRVRSLGYSNWVVVYHFHAHT